MIQLIAIALVLAFATVYLGIQQWHYYQVARRMNRRIRHHTR